MDWVLDNVALIISLSLDHLRLSVIPIAMGFLVSLPLGWYAHRYAWSRGIVLTTVGLLYTVPSLALFMLLPPVLGISMLSQTNVLVALSLYAAAIMVRNAADAFASIDPAALRAATALGYAEWGRFFAVELPLAGPVLCGRSARGGGEYGQFGDGRGLGGVPSLGYFFTDGFQRRIVPEVATGVIMTFLVAMALDAVLVLVGRILLPWSHLAIASTVSQRS